MRTLCIIISACLATSAYATRYHVSVSAAGTGTGLTWANAFNDLQQALSIVVPGDEIWVAAGQYKPTTGTNRAISFQLRNGVDMFGGFAGTETALEQRDIAANPTTLNGDIGMQGDNADNSYNVVTANNITTNIVLDGFRIINGRATSTAGGGGLRITNALGGNLLLRNCFVFNNYASNYGGGIYMAAANLTVENCEFLNNESGSGGAILNGNNNGGYSNLELRDCVFKGNTANIGACLHNTVRYETIVVDRCFFTNNLSANNVVVIDDFLSAKLMNSAIIGNSVNGFSSEVLRVNTFGSSTSPFELINCTIAHNRNTTTSTLQGEMVQLEDNHMQVHNCIIHGNTPYAGRQMRNGPIVTHALIQGGYASGTNILDLDPEFIAPYAQGPANFDATQYDYALLFSSPAVNVGDNDRVPPGFDLDLANAPRIQGGVVDLGCYESSFSVAVGATHAVPQGWYFDAGEGALHVLNAEVLKGATVSIHDMSGRLVERRVLRERVMRLDLPPGVYLAMAEGLEVLRFVLY